MFSTQFFFVVFAIGIVLKRKKTVHHIENISLNDHLLTCNLNTLDSVTIQLPY